MTIYQRSQNEAIPGHWKIISLCADVLGCGPYQITGSNRYKPIRDYRHIVAVELLSHGYTYAATGQALGGRDHSTIVHSRKQYEALFDTDPEFRVKALACRYACEETFKKIDITL